MIEKHLQIYKGIEHIALKAEKGGACYVVVVKKVPMQTENAFVYESIECIARFTVETINGLYREAHHRLRSEDETDLAKIVYNGQLGTIVQRLTRSLELKLPERTRLIDLEHLTEYEVKEFKAFVLRGLTE